MTIYKPFVYFQKEEEAGTIVRFHVRVLVQIPNGYKATAQSHSQPADGFYRELNIQIEEDETAINIGPVYVYFVIEVGEINQNCDLDEGNWECEPGFVVAVIEHGSANTHSHKNNYDNADGFPIGGD